MVRVSLAERLLAEDHLLAAVKGAAGSPAPAALKKNAEPQQLTPSPSTLGEGRGEGFAARDTKPRPSPGVPEEGVMPAPIANVEPIDVKDFAAVMSRLRDAIHQHAPGIDAFLSHGKLVAVESGQAVLRYSSDHEASVQILSRNGKKEVIQKELGDLLKEPVNVRF